MSKIIITDQRCPDEKVSLALSGHVGYAVLLYAEEGVESVTINLTSKQARALAGWINSNVPKDNDGIEVIED